METGIAILALSFGVSAIVISIAADYRTRRATRELARELVQLRNRLLRAEGLAGDGPESAAQSETSARVVEAMAERIETLEIRLRDALERRSDAVRAAVGSTPSDPGERVVEELRRNGYGRIVVLDVRGDGDVLVEAERDGVLAKGLARVQEDGAVTIEGVSSVRAFP